MAELFIELFSEEIPSRLQIDARREIKKMLEDNLRKKEISFNLSHSFSTPKRLVFFVKGIPEKIEQKGKVIKGPRVDSPETALNGFIKSNNLNKSDVYKKTIEKGEFYFANMKSKKIDVLNEIQVIIPEILKTYTWKKSMKWSTYDLSWARPLKSIVSLFNNKVINFNFFHLRSGNLTFIDGVNDEKIKKISNFGTYLNILNGKTENYNQRFENDYWGSSIKELVYKTKLSKNSKIVFSSCGIAEFSAKYYLKKAGFTNFSFESLDKSNFIIMTNRSTYIKENINSSKNVTNCFVKFEGENITEVKRNGVVLSVIRKIN